MEPDKTTSQKVALAVVAAYSDEERVILLAWARQVLAIRESELSFSQKLLRITKLTNQLGLTKPLLGHLASEVKRVAWTNRTKSMRGVIGGAGVGLVLSIGAPMAGVAAFGGAIAVPVILLGMGGGALLNAFIEEFSKPK